MMTEVYSLKDDRDLVRSVQKATLETKDFGIQQTHGLFGSDEWWTHIADGSLPVHTVRGTISRTWMGSMRDWPECEVLSDEGEKSTWTRYADDSWYQIGNRIEIDYVIQKFKPSAQEIFGTLDHKNVLAIRIERQTQRGDPANCLQPPASRPSVHNA
jgi:hypothetical protein